MAEMLVQSPSPTARPAFSCPTSRPAFHRESNSTFLFNNYHVDSPHPNDPRADLSEPSMAPRIRRSLRIRRPAVESLPIRRVHDTYDWLGRVYQPSRRERRCRWQKERPHYRLESSQRVHVQADAKAMAELTSSQQDGRPYHVGTFTSSTPIHTDRYEMGPWKP
jgi:hypothetical protein